MAIEKLSGSQKAAILLFSLGEEMASTIVKQLDEGEIKKIGGSISKLSSFSPKIVETILSEFQEASSSQLPIQIGHEGGSKFIKSIVSRAINGEKAQNLIEEIQEEGKWNLFQKIRRLDPKTVSNFIRTEHPQTIAIILTHLDSSQSSAILEEFSPVLQTEVICRIAELENIPPGIVEEIDQVLQQEIATIKGFEGQKRGGVRLAAEILNQMEGL